MLPGLGESGGRSQDMGWSFIPEINRSGCELTPRGLGEPGGRLVPAWAESQPSLG